MKNARAPIVNYAFLPAPNRDNMDVNWASGKYNRDYTALPGYDGWRLPEGATLPGPVTIIK